MDTCNLQIGVRDITYHALSTQINYNHNLISTSDAAVSVASALLGYPPKAIRTKEIDECAIDTLREVVDFNSSRWHCLGFGVDLSQNPLD